MGQYYKPICLDTREWLYTHDYNNDKYYSDVYRSVKYTLANQIDLSL